MSITTNGKNQMLDALDVASLSLHTAFPGVTGASEVTGGTYARQAVTFGAAAAGVRSMTSPCTVDVPAATIAWVGLWDTAGTAFIAYSPNGGDPKEFQLDTSTDVVTCVGHGFSDTDTITFYGDTAPAPLVEGTVYYVRDATTDTFKVAASSGGAAIDLTAQPAGGCVVSAITLSVYGAADTHTVSTWAIGLPH